MRVDLEGKKTYQYLQKVGSEDDHLARHPQSPVRSATAAKAKVSNNVSETSEIILAVRALHLPRYEGTDPQCQDREYVRVP